MTEIKHFTGNFRWRIVALLFFSTTINYLDRQVVGILKPYIADDLGWTEAGYGYIITAFSIAYALGLILTGRLLDKFGTRIGYSLAIVVWSIAGIGHAFAKSIFSFGTARFFLGFGESANFPAAIKAIAEWFPKKERALATGLFNSGSNLGALIAPVIVVFVTVKFGWQWAFIITGLLGFAWLLFWLPTYKIPGKHPKLSATELNYIHSDNEDTGDQLAWKDIIKYRQTIAICIAKFATDWVWWFFLYWTPDFLNKVYGVDIKEVIIPLILIYTVAGLGGIAGGWLSSGLIGRGYTIDKSRKIALLVCAILTLSILLIANTAGLWYAIIFICIGIGAHQGWSSNIFTLVSDIFPKNAVGSVTGLAGFTGAVSGALSASFVGLILQITNSYLPIFSIAGISYLISWVILKIMIPKIEPIRV